jgi:plasmid stabilization system protein ParE
VTYRFLPPAAQDLTDAVAYYERAVAGLGLQFVEEVERTVHRILQQPEAWARVSEHHRRCRTRRFPYGLIYTVEQDVVVIVAVMHLHRHPATWKKRIE